MGSKISLILSLFFVSIFFLLGGDLISLQYIYSDLDAKSVTISYLVAKSGRVDDEYRKTLENRFDVSLTFKTKETPRYGDVVDYVVIKSFQPIIMSQSSLNVQVNRSAMIGYYG